MTDLTPKLLHEESFEQLRDHVHALDADAAGAKVDLTRDIVVICPDDGKFVAFRGRCPKCGGESWVPAGKLTREQEALIKQLQQMRHEEEAERTPANAAEAPQPPAVGSDVKRQETGEA